MKINWGYKILFVYLAFVAGIVFLAFKASAEKFDLVRADYYDAELKYQDVINQEQRVSELSSAPKLRHTINSISVQLPNEFLNAAVKGELYLYRASDASKDLRRNFSSGNGFVEIPLGTDVSGSYEVKLSWQSEGKTFYHEQKLFF